MSISGLSRKLTASSEREESLLATHTKKQDGKHNHGTIRTRTGPPKSPHNAIICRTLLRLSEPNQQGSFRGASANTVAGLSQNPRRVPAQGFAVRRLGGHLRPVLSLLPPVRRFHAQCRVRGQEKARKATPKLPRYLREILADPMGPPGAHADHHSSGHTDLSFPREKKVSQIEALA